MANRLLEDIKKTQPTSSNRLLQDIQSRGVDLGAVKTVPTISVEEPKLTEEDYKKKYKAERSFGQTLLGVAKGAASTLAGAASVGEKILQAPLRAVGMRVPEKSAVQEMGLQEKLAPTTTGQKLGFGVEQAGEFLIPGGVSTKIGKATEAIAKGGKFVKGLTKLGARSAAEAGVVGGQSLIQSGGDTGEALTGAIIGGSIPVAGKVIKGLGKGIKTIGTASLGKTTGAGRVAIQEAYTNPNVIKFAREAGAEGAEGLQTKALDEAKKASKTLRERASLEYSGQLEKIKVGKQNLDEAALSLRNQADSLVSKDGFDIRPVQKVDALGNKINDWDFSKSTITEKSEVAKKVLNDVYSWTDWSPKGLDILKKRLFDFAKDARGSKAEVLVNDLAHNLDKSLKKLIPDYEKMTAKWRKWKDLEDELNNTLSLSDKKSKDTAIRKLMSSMKENNETRKELVDLLTKTSGEDITGMLAGSQLAPIMPRGLAGGGVGIGTAGLSAFSVANPTTWPLVIAYLGSSSPRLVAEFVSLIGKARRGANGLIEMTPLLRTQIKRLMDSV
jgi:hypothetical protein